MDDQDTSEQEESSPDSAPETCRSHSSVVTTVVQQGSSWDSPSLRRKTMWIYGFGSLVFLILGTLFGLDDPAIMILFFPFAALFAVASWLSYKVWQSGDQEYSQATTERP